MSEAKNKNKESIVLGGGCFWCLEAIFKRIPGIVAITSGYAGGKTEDPNYWDVCSGETGHAEVNKIEFDENIISLEKVLKVFFLAHDPTSLNRQGNDIGTEYRSIILFNNNKQKEIINKVIKSVQKEYDKTIVTEVLPLEIFYPAEAEHQNYYDNNTNQPYCRFVIQPKLDKVLKELTH
ncbi:MAG TPA: peptide-methionine (S)-S-oxide reductase MsrA [Candidatus Dojkabacteria bacterium]|nr:peptide-methionine (S)-S-oxide reductase MsrA [Candidatus Dojkabacteria bacterium]